MLSVPFTTVAGSMKMPDPERQRVSPDTISPVRAWYIRFLTNGSIKDKADNGCNPQLLSV